MKNKRNICTSIILFLKQVCTIFICTLLITAVFTEVSLNAKAQEESVPNQFSINTESELKPLIINSLAAILINADTGEILINKDIDGIYYPASITKIMTALLVMEHYDDFDARINFSSGAIDSLPLDSSGIDMIEGESLSIDEAMYGLMLASANEVANAFAEDIARREIADTGASLEFDELINDFALLMTERAKELGALNTSFENPHGLFGEEHYTTARDMALIMREAIKHPRFVKYISTATHIIPATEKSEQRELTNSNKMIIENSEFYYAQVIGGKTGYIDESRHTLVTYAARGDVKLIAAILHGEKNEPYIDTKALLEYGFWLYGVE